MATLRAGALAKLRAESLGLTPAPPEPVQMHEPPPPAQVPARAKTPSTRQPRGPSVDLIEAARLARLAHEYRDLVEAEDMDGLINAGVDESDAGKLVTWQRSRRELEEWTAVRTKYPVFADEAHPLPLKIGVHEDLAAVIGPAAAKRILARWCRRKQYKAALTAGATRYSLDGTPTGTVTETEAAAASCRT